MQLNKLPILVFFLLIKFSAFADLVYPKTLSLTDTKYYFVNVDSFPGYKFFAKRLYKGKMYKIKQDNSVLIEPKAKNEVNRLSVWGVNKKNNQQTNPFTLEAMDASEVQGNMAHIAISFYFDKDSVLEFRQSAITPPQNKKQLMTFFSSDNPDGSSNGLVYVSLFALVVLLSMFIFNRTYQRSAHV